MDHFENIVRLLLEAEGYWVLSSFKVDLTKEEKVLTGKGTIPRPEIDLLAWRPQDKSILAIEVKSFFNSTGVTLSELQKNHVLAEGKYKLFTTPRYREIVFKRTILDLISRGYLNEPIPIQLGLVAGKVKNSDHENLKIFMRKKGWFYWSPDDVKRKVISLATSKYENEALHICAKIILN